MLTETGQLLYEDEYQTKYDVSWETIGGTLDITTITEMPYVWGEEASGKVENRILYREGVITIHRQAIKQLDGGYEIVAEGFSQYCDLIQMNYKCETPPSDPFKYHLNYFIQDETPIKVLEGSHWADPADPDDSDAIWGDLNADGSPVEDLTGTGVLDILSWLDVWS
tara:strand:- start:1047 stop:1547 length:501 start_codon:yes stop_codon:yes gene_type:complete